MENIFGIMYDLRSDIHYNDVLKPLGTLSLLRFIPRYFTSDLLIKYFLLVYPEVTDVSWDKRKDKKVLWDNIEEKVVSTTNLFVPFLLQRESAEVIHFVGTEIFFFLTKIPYPLVTVIFILKNLVFNWQGTINLEKTFLKVLDVENIPVSEKFEIACKTFMSEGTILKYFLLFPLAASTYLNEHPIKKQNIPIYFWICRFTGYFKKIDISDFQSAIGCEFKEIYFSNMNNPLNNKYLLYWSVCTFNDMAVQYLWERFISRSRDKERILIDIFSKVINDFRMINCVIYLLTKLSNRQTTTFFRLRYTLIFKYLLVELRWQNLFGKVLEALHINFSEAIYIDIFKYMIRVLSSTFKDKFDVCLFNEFLIKMPVSLKLTFLTDQAFFLCVMIPKLYSRGDLETCSLLCTTLGPLDASSVFITHLRMTLFDLLIINNNSNIIEHILEYSLVFPALINEFKNNFYRVRAVSLCKYFILKHKTTSLISFTNWCLTIKPRQDINQLKLNVIGVNGNFLKRVIFQDRVSEDALEYVDEVLRWCSDSQDFATRIKKCIIMVKESDNPEHTTNHLQINVYEELKDCVQNFQTTFIRRFISWKSCTNEEITEIINCLLNDDEFYQNFWGEIGERTYFLRVIGMMFTNQ
ncbi:UNVERIFIED_CONTAM: hypothetical protein RMT77_018170 [Armadillidium vulgare]